MNIRLNEYIIWGRNVALSRFGFKIFSVNLEVTKKCNARCIFCNYWKTKQESHLLDYVPIIKHLDPITVVITGGEPLLRNDIVEIITDLKKEKPLLRVSMITNGILLTADIATALYNAGLDQLSISLDFLDERHDLNRGHKGLSMHIMEIIKKIDAKGMGLSLNTVIMKENLDVVLDIAKWAAEQGISVGYSCYSDVKTHNRSHMVPPAENKDLIEIIDGLVLHKRFVGNITNSEYYLRRIPKYFRNGRIESCQAGIRWLQVTPEGHLKRCSEHPIQCDWSEYSKDAFAATQCGRCWFACRGESQAPLQWSRVKKYGAFLLRKVIAQ
ncbi:radical SAM protein [Thermodesulfobacteriota bacterium]